jgi:hypothetical protein
MPEWVQIFLSVTSGAILMLAAYIASKVNKIEGRQYEQTNESSLIRRDVDALKHQVSNLHEWRNLFQREEVTRLEQKLTEYRKKHGEL